MMKRRGRLVRVRVWQRTSFTRKSRCRRCRWFRTERHGSRVCDACGKAFMRSHCCGSIFLKRALRHAHHILRPAWIDTELDDVRAVQPAQHAFRLGPFVEHVGRRQRSKREQKQPENQQARKMFVYRGHAILRNAFLNRFNTNGRNDLRTIGFLFKDLNNNKLRQLKYYKRK